MKKELSKMIEQKMIIGAGAVLNAMHNKEDFTAVANLMDDLYIATKMNGSTQQLYREVSIQFNNYQKNYFGLIEPTGTLI